MFVPNSEIIQFLEDKGFARDNSKPFTYVGYKHGKEWLIMDESHSFQDINFLIDDAETFGSLGIASELKEWRQQFKFTLLTWSKLHVYREATFQGRFSVSTNVNKHSF